MEKNWKIIFNLTFLFSVIIVLILFKCLDNCTFNVILIRNLLLKYVTLNLPTAFYTVRVNVITTDPLKMPKEVLTFDTSFIIYFFQIFNFSTKIYFFFVN